MEEGTYPMNLDLDSGGELPTRPAEEGRRLQAQHVSEHFAPEFANNTELEPGTEVGSDGLRDRSDEAEQNEKPNDLGHRQAGEAQGLRRRLRPQITLQTAQKRADHPGVAGGGRGRNQHDREGRYDKSEAAPHRFQ